MLVLPVESSQDFCCILLNKRPKCGSMEQDEFIGIRVSQKLKRALERERRRRSRAAGAQVGTSAVIRALLEQALSKPKPSRASA